MQPKTAPKNSDAARKRSIARRFNDALAGRSVASKTTDQRTLRRLERYREELRKGAKAGKTPLTPLDVALRVDELLRHGDTTSMLRKLFKPRSADYTKEAMVALLKEMHPVYKYAPAAYRFAGVDDETLLAAGIIEKIPARRGPKKGNGTEEPKKKAPAKKRTRP
jgi:hypothetical protein